MKPTTTTTIEVSAVRSALTVARHPLSSGAATARPLLTLACVEARLAEQDLAGREANRWRALAALLADLAWAQLSALRAARSRSPGPVAQSLGRDGVLAELGADFQAGSHARECWGALYTRFLAPVDVPVVELARAAGVGRVTFARRLNEGLALLTEDLRRAEVAARSARAPALAEPPAARPAPELPPGPATAAPAGLTAYRLARIAEWSRPEQALDRRFVSLSLLVDRGPLAPERWQATAVVYDSLAEAIEAAGSPAVVVLGPPGGGKSTLLRQHELALAAAGLRGESNRVTFYVPLARYQAGSGATAPRPWLEARWASRLPQLPPLAQFLSRGQVTLLLDGLNEMPHGDAVAYHHLIGAWKELLLDTVTDGRGNQAIFTCRNLDYSAPLSGPDLPVPQIQILPLSEGQQALFFEVYGGKAARRLWPELAASPLLDAVRVPYGLRILAEQAAASGTLPHGRAALFTALVRHSLRRELERGGAHLVPGPWLSADDLRQVTAWRWRDDHDLPSRGRLFDWLSDLAGRMQGQSERAGDSQVALPRRAAAEAGTDPGEPLALGVALGLLTEDLAGDEVAFSHQLLQEYFAARRQAAAPPPAAARAIWRVDEVRPPLATLLATLGPGERLPALLASGWEETLLMAAEMTAEPARLIDALMAVDLVLAGRVAAQGPVARRLPADLLCALRSALVARSRDPAADLRARIAAGLALGPLGDPRFERSTGPAGAYLVPPTVALAGGSYPVGRDTPFEAMGRQWPARYAAHTVRLAPFGLGTFLVTNAEWACFMAAGGYEDEHWWPTPVAAAWRRGEGTTAGIHASTREWTARYRAEPELLEETYRTGSFGEVFYERWKRRVAMSDSELQRHLDDMYPSVRRTEPRFWRDEQFSNPAQPVVGITWHEARAYTLWLVAQTGRPWRLPRDVELEAAARGPGGREYPYGADFSPLGGNTVASLLRRTTPVGVFVDGDTPEGLTDMSGNAECYTSTLAEPPGGWRQPARRRYVPALEDARAPDTSERVLRGGSWRDNHTRAHPAYGVSEAPDTCPDTSGLRLALDVDAAE